MSYDPLAWIPKNPCLTCDYYLKLLSQQHESVCVNPNDCQLNLIWRIKLQAVKIAMEHVQRQATGNYKDLNGNEMQALPLDTVDRNLADLNKAISEAEESLKSK